MFAGSSHSNFQAYIGYTLPLADTVTSRDSGRGYRIAAVDHHPEIITIAGYTWRARCRDQGLVGLGNHLKISVYVSFVYRCTCVGLCVIHIVFGGG